MNIPEVLPGNFPLFSSLHLQILINKPVMFVILGVFFVVYSIVSAVLFYHWHAYGMRSRGIIVAETVFTLVSLSLFSFSVLSILYY